MHRIDYLNDPDAPEPNSIVIATSTFVEDDDQRLLMIHRTDNDLWALPGGGIELGETVTECAIRETREETGIEIAITSLIGIFTNPAHVVAYPDGEVRQQFSICLRGQAVGGNVTTSDESSEVVWVAPGQLDTLNIHPDTRLRIDRGMRHDTTAWVD